LTKATEALAQKPAAEADQFDNALSQEIEGLFGSLGEEYQGLLGEGSIWDYKPGSKEHGFVNEVFEQMAALDTGYQARGQELPTKDLFNKALALASHDHLKEISRKEILGKVKKQSDSAMTAPARKGAVDAATGLSKEDAVSGIASAMRESGFMDL